jgi:hypothetical protein
VPIAPTATAPPAAIAAPAATPPTVTPQPTAAETKTGETTGAEPPSEPASAAEEAEVEVEEPPREPAPPALLDLEIAPALLIDPGGRGLGPRFDGFGNVRLQPLSMISFSAFVLAPILQSPARSAAGHADVRTLAVGGGADLQLPFSFWEFSAGLGAAALVTWVHGSPNTADVAVRDQTLRTAALLARIGLSYQLSGGVRVSARAIVGFAIPTLRVVFLNDTIVRWGEPFALGTLGLDINLL